MGTTVGSWCSPPARPGPRRCRGRLWCPRAGRDDDIDLGSELEAIYVRQAYWGSGLADRLLEVSIGDEPAYLWVFETNERARGFYARHGFVPDGTAKHDPFFDRNEIRMVRR